MIDSMRNLTRRALMPAVFFACVAAWSVRAAEPERLTFCCYNLKNWLTTELPDPLGQAPGAAPATRTKPEAEKEAVVKILAAIKPDILGVCEIGDADDLADLQRRLLAVGVDLPHTEIAHGGDKTRRLGLLSRLPIKARHSQLDLAYRTGAVTQPMQRGILDVTIALSPGFEMHCVGVHLKSKRVVAEADQAQMRRNEAWLLRRHLDEIFKREPNAAILTYGDFNELRNEPAIDDVMGSPRTGDTALQDVPLRDVDGEVWTHFWDDADLYSRLDYCLISRLLRPHVDQRASFVYSSRDFYKASDHRPLVLKLSAEPIVGKR